MAECMTAQIFYPHGDPVGAGRLVAYGIAFAQKVNATLTDLAANPGPEINPIKVKVLHQPQHMAETIGYPLWIIEFTEVQQKKNYYLDLNDTKGMSLAHVLVEVDTYPGLETKTTSPKPNSTIPSTCVASGTASNNGVVSGTMISTDGLSTVNGFQIQGGEYWSIRFSGLIVGKTYTLNVSVGGEAAPPVTELTVANMHGG
jgi:hypothetical protein